jgi:hypothetical protein
LRPERNNGHGVMLPLVELDIASSATTERLTSN